MWWRSLGGSRTNKLGFFLARLEWCEHVRSSGGGGGSNRRGPQGHELGVTWATETNNPEDP